MAYAIFWFLAIKLFCLVKMNAFSPPPEFDGRAENFASFRQEAELWLMVTHLPANRRAPALALAMGKVPRERCLSLGTAALNCDNGVGNIMEAPQKNLAPDASDAGFRDIVDSFGLRRGHLALDAYLSRFEMSRRRAEARFPNKGFFPGIMLSSLRLQNSGITPNQKSMILSSAGGDPSLDAVKRHMRRILQPCRMALKQDALAVKDDLSKSQALPSGSAAYDASGNGPVTGDANMAPQKKKNRRKGKLDPPRPRGRMGASPIKLIPVRATAIDATVAEVNFIYIHSARENSRRPLGGRPLRWLPPIKTSGKARMGMFTHIFLDWDRWLAAREAPARLS